MSERPHTQWQFCVFMHSHFAEHAAKSAQYSFPQGILAMQSDLGTKKKKMPAASALEPSSL